MYVFVYFGILHNYVFLSRSVFQYFLYLYDKQNLLIRMNENFNWKISPQLSNTLYIIRNPRKLYIEISADLVHPGLSEREG